MPTCEETRRGTRIVGADSIEDEGISIRFSRRTGEELQVHRLDGPEGRRFLGQDTLVCDGVFLHRHRLTSAATAIFVELKDSRTHVVHALEQLASTIERLLELRCRTALRVATWQAVVVHGQRLPTDHARADKEFRRRLGRAARLRSTGCDLRELLRDSP